MKKNNFVLLFAILCLAGVAGCNKSDLVHKSEFEKSYDTWNTFKAASDNSYTYTVVGGTWIGIGWETTLTVENGVVIRRAFMYHVPDDWQGEIPEDEKEWIENGDEVGSHQSGPAAAIVTLDEIYEKAKNDWLKKRKDATTYFEAKNNGMISTAGYIPDGCQDDCFVGIDIRKINTLSENTVE